MLIRPTQLQVIDAFHQHLAQTGRHSATSKELAAEKRWNLTEVSSALNQAYAKGALIREGATFRAAANQKGKPITNPELPAKPKPKPAQPVGERWPEDEEFIARYEPALRSPDGPRAALRAEFRRPYGTIGYHATAVYRRLGLEKPTARGFRHPPVDKEAWPSDLEFVQRYEPTLKTPSDARGALEDEFGRPYRSINEHAKTVYARLKLPRPCGKRGWPTPPPKVAKSATVAEVTEAPLVPADPVANTVAATHRLSSEQLEMFFADGEESQRITSISSPALDKFHAQVYGNPGQPQETPATLDGPDPWDSPSVTPSEPEGDKGEVVRTIGLALSAKCEESKKLWERLKIAEANNADLERRYNAKSDALNTEQIESARTFAMLEEARNDNVRLIEKANDAFFKVDELTAENSELRIRINEKEETLKDVEEGNCDLWAKLRQADADLTERDEAIRIEREAVSILQGAGSKAQEEIERLKERMETQIRTISNLRAQINEAEAKPQEAVLTLKIPKDWLRLEVSP